MFESPQNGDMSVTVPLGERKRPHLEATALKLELVLALALGPQGSQDSSGAGFMLR